jgi:hypothetical protein
MITPEKKQDALNLANSIVKVFVDKSMGSNLSVSEAFTILLSTAAKIYCVLHEECPNNSKQDFESNVATMVKLIIPVLLSKNPNTTTEIILEMNNK